MPPARCSAALLAMMTATLGCGPKAAPRALDNRSAPAATADQAPPLADDVAALTRAAHDGEQYGAWTQRVTFLGWTGDHGVAYRVLLCDPAELGGRGPFCELQVCVAIAAAGAAPADAYPDPACEAAASFELYGDLTFDATATTAAAEAAVAKLGPLARGTAKPLDRARLTIADLTLTAQLLDGPRRTIVAGLPDDDRGAVSVAATYVGDSPDGRCRTAVGRYGYRSEYEGVHGTIPNGFAVVACATP